MTTDSTPPRPSEHPGFWEAFRFWLKLGLISFGGPTGQIAIMHRELVEKRRWISEARFLHALNYCMLLPGPEAQQLATYIGWLLHKTRGGIVAGVLFVLPSALLLWALSYVYVSWGELAWVSSIFDGLQPVVLGIIAAAVIRIGRKALKTRVMWVVAALAFLALFALKVPFPAVILGAGLVGWIGHRLQPAWFVASLNNGNGSVLDDTDPAPAHTRPSSARAFRTVTICLLLWWTPVLLAGLILGTGHTLFRQGIFFSKAAMVTFGGAYAVLPYVTTRAVENFGWLNAGQMLDGLGLAETTPGPLIIVLQFVGFLGGWNHPGSLPPLAAATLGAFLTTWVTFVPSFLWIFLGAPHIEQLRGNVALGAALSSITAAVVGVILNLAVWFAIHLFWPASGRLDWFAVVLSAGALFALVKWKWDILLVIAGGAIAGLVYGFFR